MKALTTLLCGLVLAFALGCGHQSGVRTGVEESYLHFVGDLEAVEVSLDGAAPVSLAEFKKKSVLATSPGKHRIDVSRAGQLVVQREVLLVNGVTMEIAVP